MRRTNGALVAAVVLVGGWTVLRAQAPGAGGSQDIMPALLEEVRGLRSALEQMSSAGPRVQLALGRLQLQEQRLNTAIKRLDDTRARMTAVQREQADLQEQLATLETFFKDGRSFAVGSSTGDMPTAEQLEEIRKQQRHRLAELNKDLQRLAVEESVSATDVAGEQARWTDLNQRLEDLERALRPLK